MMNSTAQWSLKRLAYAAIINCSAQEYDTSSTTNDEGDHCEKEDGSARPTPHYLWSIREKDQKPTVPTRRCGALAGLFYDNPEYQRHPNYTKTDQLPISEVITGLPRPYHHNDQYSYSRNLLVRTRYYCLGNWTALLVRDPAAYLLPVPVRVISKSYVLRSTA